MSPLIYVSVLLRGERFFLGMIYGGLMAISLSSSGSVKPYQHKDTRSAEI
ncbi:hypothetical protein RF679_16470 [Undibacterium cyanobacteriorum]|uniref:Uncharacterized protein n=1 Tax=Undibacterium cyanobacteriorum TaxID=3073561 RepID=A0ABY9RG71_9BURK|nr:hypothetical protein [Undibacterium sp. 20NA77.5]WMW80226.1 hypothetical protein RF679_16470 [Undibacterium sp. 20NA77.5]